MVDGFDLGQRKRFALDNAHIYGGVRSAPQAIAARLCSVLLFLAGCASVRDVRVTAIRGALQPRSKPTERQHQKRRFHRSVREATLFCAVVNPVDAGTLRRCRKTSDQAEPSGHGSRCAPAAPSDSRRAIFLLPFLGVTNYSAPVPLTKRAAKIKARPSGLVC